MADEIDLETFLNNPELYEVADFTQEMIGEDGIRRLVANLKTNELLYSLHLNLNGIEEKDAILIGESLRQNDTLQDLSFEGNDLGPYGVNGFLEGLGVNQTLQTLNLAYTGIAWGGVLIGMFLKTNRRFVKLILHHNNIGPESGVAIGKSLETNQTLLELDLADNNLGPEGGVAIGQNLETNQSLIKLYLADNNLGPEGGKAIGQSLQTNQTLLELYLDHNNLGNDGVVAVVRGIALNNQNTSITTLSITCNYITRLPAELTQCPPTLTKFHYSGNPIDYIPPNVQRWLDRFQQQQNAHIHQDSQNVHNRQIQKCIKDSINRILNHTIELKYKSLEEVRDVIVNDPILSSECKSQLIEYAFDDTVHTELQLTFADLLQYVMTRIDLNQENGEEIKRILNQEMSDALCMCFTGRISRLLNCLTGIDPLVHVHVVNLSDMFINVGKGLIKDNHYSQEAHQTQFEKELQEHYGYELTEEFRKELEEKFYCEIEDFHDTFSVNSIGEKTPSSSKGDDDDGEKKAKRQKKEVKDEKDETEKERFS